MAPITLKIPGRVPTASTSTQGATANDPQEIDDVPSSAESSESSESDYEAGPSTSRAPRSGLRAPGTKAPPLTVRLKRKDAPQESGTSTPLSATSSKRIRLSTSNVASPAVTDDSDGEVDDAQDMESSPEPGAMDAVPVANVTVKGSKFLTQLLKKSKARSANQGLGGVVSNLKDLGGVRLKADHESRPLWIDGDGKIILEGFSAIAEQAQDFLIAIAEPVSRPSFIHEYQLNEYSLYAAMSVGLETEDIVEVLGRLSKTALPPRLINDIRRWTASYGKLKLVLKKNKYTLESPSNEIIMQCLEDDVIGKCRVAEEVVEGEAGAVAGVGVTVGGTGVAGVEVEARTRVREAGDLISAVIGIDRNDEIDEDETIQSFEINPKKIEEVKKRCTDIGLPVLEEYDFRQDHNNANLEIDLKPLTVIRPYQETSLSKMFGNGRARSGIIVLPCGAGKTLVGITAACTIKKSTLVLCTSAVSVQQWKAQFLMFSNISERQICCFTSQESDFFAGAEKGAAGIVISTYSMVSNQGKRSHTSQKFMDFLRAREWGFLLLDEVHVAPANQFRQCVSGMKTHAKLGLTATLVREDEKISDLNYLIGPKLYEANWMDLAKKGHIANVQCAEVWCPMTPEFYTEYLKEDDHRKRSLLQIMNPNKFQACQFLINYHEARGDKVIVFSDNVFALMQYAKRLGKAAIYGATAEIERLRILSRFQVDPNMNTIFLSKVGDTSIDLPEATCLIQISAHYGSRRQEAQRLGRILRAKRRNDEGFNAFFYTLVSTDTQEMYFSAKRQGFLIDQGYSFKVISQLQGLKEMPDLAFPTQEAQIELLEKVLLESQKSSDDFGDYGYEKQLKKPKKGSVISKDNEVVRNVGSMQALAGGQHMSYVERGKTMNARINSDAKAKKKAGNSGRHSIFTKRDADIKKARNE